MSFKPLTSWSFSRYGTYVNCPAKFKYGTLMKLPEPKNAAMQRGADLHGRAAEYLTGKLTRLPKDLELFKDLFKALRAKKKKAPEQVVVEDNWAFRKDWTATTWDDWNHCWVRIKLDNAELDGRRLIVRDWKTGQLRAERNQEYLEQLDLYALGGMLQFAGEIDEVAPQLVYTDQGKIFEARVYPVAELKVLKKEWEKRVAPMFKDKTFKPKPSNNCRRCHHRKANGGPCQY